MSTTGVFDKYWGNVWPGALPLGQFIYANRVLFCDKVVVELGAGSTALVGFSAAKAGAKKVILTEFPGNKEALSQLKVNLQRNFVDKNRQKITIQGLDWNSSLIPKTDFKIPGNVRTFVDSLKECDYIVASDVFYDSTNFRAIVRTVGMFIEKFPLLRFYFSYQPRDDSYSIEALLHIEKLSCRLIRQLENEDTIQLCVLFKPSDTMVFAGIEGGATHSQLIFVNDDGTESEVIGGPGTNMCLEGIENVANTIGTWIRKEAADLGIALPLKGLGLGLSGAEDEGDNQKMITYLESFHGDIAEHFAITADSYCTIQASFEEGVVFIAGTGSAVRLQLADGSRFGVGGWGHMIGDGASGFWIAQKAIRVLFDHDDGLQVACGDVSTLRKTFLEHFSIDRKEEILSHLYVNFQKPHIAKVTKDLAAHGDDPVIAHVFYEAGEILAKQFVAIARHMPQSMLECSQVVIIGSVFNSWHLLEQGFCDTVRRSDVKKVRLCRPGNPPAFGGAVIGANAAGTKLKLANSPILFRELNFEQA